MFGIVPEKFLKPDSDIMKDINCDKAHAVSNAMTKSHVLRHNASKEDLSMYSQRDEDKSVTG